MITPLGVRQMFQTAHMEAGRVAHEVAGLLGREAAQKKMIDDRLDDAKDDVRMIAEADALRTEERARERERERRRREGKGQGDEEGESSAQAGSAENHLDLLA